MDLKGRTAALYGRFSPGGREELSAKIARRGGTVVRDLTRRSDLLVVGAQSFALIQTGRLEARIAAANARGTPVSAERHFAEALKAAPGAGEFTLPVSSIKDVALTPQSVEVLAAFDIVRLQDGCCRFADAKTLKTASELFAARRSLADIVRILTEVRDRAPSGRRKIVLDAQGNAALKWAEGLTGLDGQGFLPLGEDSPSIDDLFERAALAESEGDLDEAGRLYDHAARADRKDPIAPYNLGAVRLAAELCGEAALAFRQAIARDPQFVEARYNLAAACERLDKPDLAREQLIEALRIDSAYADARFNLAQLELKRGALLDARMHFERYLASGPSPEWADIARRAIRYCSTAEAAGGAT